MSFTFVEVHNGIGEYASYFVQAVSKLNSDEISSSPKSSAIAEMKTSKPLLRNKQTAPDQI